MGNGKRWFSAGGYESREQVKLAWVKGQQAMGAARNWLRGNSMVIHPHNGLEEGVQSTLSFHCCKFGGSANTREGKRRGEAGEDRRLAARGRFVPAEERSFQSHLMREELGTQKRGNTFGSHAGMLEGMRESR